LFLSSNVISARVVETRVSGYPLSMRFDLNCEIAAINAVSEELVCYISKMIITSLPMIMHCSFDYF